MAYLVKSFRRKGGTIVKAHKRTKPTLSAMERARRARQAKGTLLPAGIKAAGARGFTETAEKLRGKPGVTSPEKLAGWLKGQAKEKGELSPKHPYVGRRGFRKYPKLAKGRSKTEYKRLLAQRRRTKA